ncbi:MAG: acetylglutamate kinase [Cyclobacteriaceae bacterium]
MKTLVIKYGGNAMTSPDLKNAVIKAICEIQHQGHRVIIVHGGGPFINTMLELAGIQSEFIDGHRKTDPASLRYIEMTLKGEVNSDLVRLANGNGVRAVGLSGKDGRFVTASKRSYVKNGLTIDLGSVGDVTSIDTKLIDLLLENRFMPIVASIAGGVDGQDYNVNADMFAGHLAGAVKADAYWVLTDVDGLLQNKNDSSSLIEKIRAEELEALKGTVIQGGMIPKIDSCLDALRGGAAMVRIINGTKPLAFDQYLNENVAGGTRIYL